MIKSAVTNFLIVLVSLLAVEGGLVNDKDDPGGLTFAGISREHHPEWSGWQIVDREIRRGYNYKSRLYENRILYSKVTQFYYQVTWQPLLLDYVPDEKIRKKIFGVAAHLGTYRAARALQYAVGVPVDGYVGPVTLKELSNDIRRGLSERIVQNIEDYQTRVYQQSIAENPKRKKYREGWIARAEAGL
jgi:lysozyme family protein